jgi:hypothetical protein
MHKRDVLVDSGWPETTNSKFQFQTVLAVHLVKERCSVEQKKAQPPCHVQQSDLGVAVCSLLLAALQKECFSIHVPTPVLVVCRFVGTHGSLAITQLKQYVIDLFGGGSGI